jgi:hypothetical protein
MKPRKLGPRLTVKRLMAFVAISSVFFGAYIGLAETLLWANWLYREHNWREMTANVERRIGTPSEKAGIHDFWWSVVRTPITMRSWRQEAGRGSRPGCAFSLSSHSRY